MCHVTAVDNARAEKRRKAIKYLCILSATRVTGDGAYLEGEVLYKTTIRELIETEDRLCVCV